MNTPITIVEFEDRYSEDVMRIPSAKLRLCRYRAQRGIYGICQVCRDDGTNAWE